MLAALISCCCNALGALLPLVAGALDPHSNWLATATALTSLAVFGAIAAHAFLDGNVIAWSTVLVLARGVLAQ